MRAALGAWPAAAAWCVWAAAPWPPAAMWEWLCWAAVKARARGLRRGRCARRPRWGMAGATGPHGGGGSVTAKTPTWSQA